MLKFKNFLGRHPIVIMLLFIVSLMLGIILPFFILLFCDSGPISVCYRYSIFLSAVPIIQIISYFVSRKLLKREATTNSQAIIPVILTIVAILPVCVLILSPLFSVINMFGVLIYLMFQGGL